MFAALAAIAFVTPALADDQAILERELGFELPEPYRFVPTHETPLYIHCNELPRSGCPHGDRGHWDVSGTVGQALYLTERWQNAPRFHDLLIANGWEVETSTIFPVGDPLFAEDISDADQRPVFERPDTYIRPTSDDISACLRRLERNYGYPDAIGMTLHIYPCEPDQ
ncbi:MAG: hypothetical protein GC188_01620 [Alphaproteobacteria bacterium]|nr:hypothetical protein [Alphaproteobacteria bacterium]